MAIAQPRPNDFTGKQRAELAKEHAEVIKERAKEMGMVSADTARRESTEILDATSPTAGAPATLIDDIEVAGVSLADDFEVVTLLGDLEQMTFGVGNHYDFEAGRKYKVAKAVASHLREKGYVY